MADLIPTGDAPCNNREKDMTSNRPRDGEQTKCDVADIGKSQIFQNLGKLTIIDVGLEMALQETKNQFRVHLPTRKYRRDPYNRAQHFQHG